MADPNMPSDSELKKRELDLKEQELALKTDELVVERRKIIWWSGPLALAVVGGLIAWATSMGVEAYKAGQEAEAKMLQAALDMVKAAAAPENIEKSRTNLRFIIDVEIGPKDLRDRLAKYLNKPDATLPSELGGAGFLGTSVARTGTSPSVPILPPAPAQDASSGETGWFYLGKTDEKEAKWSTSSAIGTFAIGPAGGQVQPVAVDGSIPSPLVGKTLQTLAPKYLRDGGVPGQRVQSPVKRTLNPGTVLLIVSIDNVGRDGGLPVLWAEVKVQK